MATPLLYILGGTNIYIQFGQGALLGNFDVTLISHFLSPHNNLTLTRIRSLVEIIISTLCSGPPTALFVPPPRVTCDDHDQCDQCDQCGQWERVLFVIKQ